VQLALTGRVAGWLAIAASVASWALACCSDPGTVTHSNAAGHAALFACDGVLWWVVG
jgi:hypothetical protein